MHPKNRPSSWDGRTGRSLQEPLGSMTHAASEQWRWVFCGQSLRTPLRDSLADAVWLDLEDLANSPERKQLIALVFPEQPSLRIQEPSAAQNSLGVKISFEIPEGVL
jgi:hypothetical protein